MKKWIYRGDRKLTDDEGRPMRLAYYLEEDSRGRAEKSLYGIKISMSREENGQTTEESSCASGISCSRELIQYMLEMFRRMSVTPTGLVEAVDDAMSGLKNEEG